MKKLLIIIFSLVITLTASAQHGFYRGHGYYAPRFTIVGGYGPYYPFYGPYFGYPYPYYSYGYNYAARPTRLDVKIEGIKNDYKERIWAVKHNKGLTHKERRQQVRNLKHERDQAITNARLNYYRKSSG